MDWPSGAKSALAACSSSTPSTDSRSHPTVTPSATVGTPMEITEVPSVWRLNSLRRFIAPDPGEMPVLESCTVRPRRFKLRAANASIIITQEGFIFFAKACYNFHWSQFLSAPKTPGAIAANRPQPILFCCFFPLPGEMAGRQDPVNYFGAQCIRRNG